MRRWAVALVALSLALVLAACSSDEKAAHDARSEQSAPDIAADGARDAVAEDAAVERARDGRTDDATDGAADAAVAPLGGWGTLSGACDVLDNTEWSSAKPFTFRNTFDFGSTAFDPNQHKGQLSAGGQKILNEGNLSQSSLLSEVFAFELLHRCELAKLLETETKIEYIDANGKKTDLLLDIDGRTVGVSVTRAVHFPHGQPMTPSEASALLQKKLGDIPLAERNAKPINSWTRSILAILAFDKQHADAVAAAYAQLDAATKAKTIVFITVTDGADLHIY